MYINSVSLGAWAKQYTIVEMLPYFCRFLACVITANSTFALLPHSRHGFLGCFGMVTSFAAKAPPHLRVQGKAGNQIFTARL
jgi:hypothetical protein